MIAHRGPSRDSPVTRTPDLAWYCPSEGDGRFLGTRRPEQAADHRAPGGGRRRRRARRRHRDPHPDGDGQRLVRPRRAVHGELDHRRPPSPPLTRRIRLLVAVNPAALRPELAAHQAETLERIAPGRIAINLVAGGGPDTGYGAPPLDHAGALRAPRRARRRPAWPASPARSTSGGASEAAVALACRVADTYLMWGEPPDAIAARIARVRDAATRPMRFGLRIHVIARDTDARGEGRGRPAAVARGGRRRPGVGVRRVRQRRPGAHERDRRRRRRLGGPRALGRDPGGPRRRRHGAGGLPRPRGRAPGGLPGRRRRPGDRVRLPPRRRGRRGSAPGCGR